MAGVLAYTAAMNNATHRSWGAAVKGCAAVLTLALMALSVQVGVAVWQATSRAAVPSALDLPAGARHLARLGRAALEGLPVNEEFGDTRSKVAAHVQQLMAQMAAASYLKGNVNSLLSAWAEIDTAAGQLDESFNALQQMAAHHAQFVEQIPVLKNRIDELVREMIASGSDASQVYLVLHQIVLIDGMVQQVNVICSGGDTAALDAVELVQDIAAFDRVLTGLRRGDSEMALRRLQGQKNRAGLTRIEAQWKPLRSLLDTIAQQASAQLAASSAVTALERGADALLASASSLHQYASLQLLLGGGTPWTGLASAILALLSGLGLWQALLRRRVYWDDQAAQLRHREQEAFAQLLDEMGALAEGDLTVKATFSEDATGALADSVNFIAQQLGARIQAMTTTVMPMPEQAEDARRMAIQLSEVGQYQMQELGAALARVQQINPCMERILAQINSPAESGRQAALETARECAELATDLAVMIETVHTISTKLAEEAGQAVQSLDALAQSAALLREAASGFILPS